MSAPLPPLLALLPPPGETLSTDDILTRFVGYTADLGLTLYPAQEGTRSDLNPGQVGVAAGSGRGRGRGR
jgi:hypothetical protein